MTAAIALNRFGLGARPDDVLPQQPAAWLLDQFSHFEERPAALAALPSASAIARDYFSARDAMADLNGEAKKAAKKTQRQRERAVYTDAVDARMQVALDTPTPFVERLVYFWANHFAVSADKGIVTPFAGAFEAEAIRPHVLGRFEDMLIAAEQHVAMEVFLDQIRSVGPQSALVQRSKGGKRKRKPGAKPPRQRLCCKDWRQSEVGCRSAPIRRLLRNGG